MKVKHIFTSILMLALSVSVFAAKPKKPKLPKLETPGIYAAIETKYGVMLIQLEPAKCPMTVASFVGLAEGKFSPNDSVSIKKPFYNGLTFHRVISNFMIQGGDPEGTGSGGPGYYFQDETDKSLKHEGKGILSMTNSDPQGKVAYSNSGNSNGSQFFITHNSTAHLDGKHTVFGKVISGLNIVDSVKGNDKMISIKIIRVGKEFKKWNASKVFRASIQLAIEKVAKEKEEERKRLEEQKRQIEIRLNNLPKIEKEGIYAAIDTKYGTMVVELTPEQTPMTVANFVGLAEGNFNPFPVNKITTPYYDGLKFHRVIPNFMIQGGDPLGTGGGNPGYAFYDETNMNLKHEGKGVLSMANSDPQTKPAFSNIGKTNGSQFFITHTSTDWLNGNHTVFGKVITGLNIVDSVKGNDIMNFVRIIRVGEKFKSWNATNAFKEAFVKAEALAKVAEEKAKIEQERIKKEKEEFDLKDKERVANIIKMSEADYAKLFFAEIKKTNPTAKQTASGLVYVIEPQGKGVKAVKGNKVNVHYTGSFISTGAKFDSSRDRNQTFDYEHITAGMIQGFHEGVGLLNEGGRGKFFMPYYLAYGKNGRAPLIPACSDLLFDIELIKVNPLQNTPPPVEEVNPPHGSEGHKH